MLKPQSCLFGEIFITNDESDGALEALNHFKGKSITSLGGGFRKLFIIEENNLNEGIVSSLHAPEYDEDDYTFSEGQRDPPLNPSDLLNAFDNKGSLKKILCGKKHMIFLTDQGKLYSYGYGEYGTLGLGGLCFSPVPKLIKSLSDRVIIQIACGESHSLALTDKRELYAWGKGFDGQLGIRNDIESASTPKFISYFYKIPVKSIACGCNHSLAITEDGKLYGWGEARLGQIGTGKKNKECLPCLIQLNNVARNVVKKHPGSVEFALDNNKNESPNRLPKIDPNQKFFSESNFKVRSVSGGFGHTIAITESGEIFSWGFNIKGQLGLGDKKTRYYPQMLTRDILDHDLPNFQFVSCGFNNSFAIDESGRLFSWGGGNLGQKNDFSQDLPRFVEAHTSNRIFTDIFANMNSAIFFAKLRIMSFRPYCGPSSGGTLMSLIGTGLTETGKQSIKFTYGQYSAEVAARYESISDCFYCVTPNFEDASEDLIDWPVECRVEITLDGVNYFACEQTFFIYSHKLTVSNIFPRCASIQGGTQLTLNMPNFDDKKIQFLNHLTVGFQSKSFRKEELTKTEKVDTPGESRRESRDKIEFNGERPLLYKGSINPLDISINDPEVERENWICVHGTYSQGKIICTIPKIENLSPENLQFNVDISLNGQQFTGQPSSFRFYDISIKSMSPTNGVSSGGSQVKLEGTGFFDTVHKKIKFKSKLGERMIDLLWDKKDKFYTFIAPPIIWLLAGKEPTEENLNEVKSNEITVYMTLSGVEWIPIKVFNYCDPEIERIIPAPPFEKDISEDEKHKRWSSEDKEPNLLEGCKTEADIEKKKAEILKQKEIEDLEMSQMFKKAGSYLYLYGKYLKNTEISAQFICQNKGKIVKTVLKNERKIGVIVPELEDLPTGIHEVFVEVSFNGQQYSNSRKSFKYLAFDKNMPQDQRNKYEEQELKNMKKPPAKK